MSAINPDYTRPGSYLASDPVFFINGHAAPGATVTGPQGISVSDASAGPSQTDPLSGAAPVDTAATTAVDAVAGTTTTVDGSVPYVDTGTPQTAASGISGAFSGTLFGFSYLTWAFFLLIAAAGYLLVKHLHKS